MNKDEALKALKTIEKIRAELYINLVLSFEESITLAKQINILLDYILSSKPRDES